MTNQYFDFGSEQYRRFRPTYPKSLFSFLATIAPERERAWDCATGTGQAAHGLAKYFSEVIATDRSPSQIAHALPHPRIRYQIADAPGSLIGRRSVDLVTVAQALHWLDFGNFFSAVKRVLKPGGILAAWHYGEWEPITPGIDHAMTAFLSEVGKHTSPEIREGWKKYAALEVMLESIRTPSFRMETRWDLPRFLGFLSTWSTTRGLIANSGIRKLAQAELDFQSNWGDPRVIRRISWKIVPRAFRMPD